jgi:hypothetical protein
MVPDGTLWLKGISMEDSGLAKDFALLVVGVGFGVLPWLLDKVGIEMPRPIYVLVGCLCILAMGWAFATLDLLDKIQLLKNRPVPLSKGIVAAFALAMLALWIGKTLFSPEPDKISYIKTELRLQFFGGQRPPSQAHADNIFTNYSLWTPSAILEVGDKARKSMRPCFIQKAGLFFSFLRNQQTMPT